MAFTREFIRNAAKESGVEIPKELEDQLISEHITARDAFAEGKAKSAKEERLPVKVEDSEEYKALKKSFEDYKADVIAKETKAAKTSAARSYYESKGINGKGLDIAIRGSGAEIDALELADGKIKDPSSLDALVNGVFAGLVNTTTTKGADTPTPPASTGGSKKTKEEIMQIKDTVERQKAMAENLELFGIK